MKRFNALADRVLGRLVDRATASADIGVDFLRCVPPHVQICGPFTRVQQSCGGTPSNPTGCTPVGCCN